jgi:hypothetical protein
MGLLLFTNFLMFLLLSVMLQAGSWQGAVLRVVTIVLTIANGLACLAQLGLVVAAPEGMRWF